MSREADIERLVNRIKDYRKNEIQFVPDARHINKWLSQFSPMTQDVILHETVHIFDDWYFTNEFVDEKIDRIPNYLLKKHSYPSISSVFQNVSFLCTQKDGKSQHEIVSRFRNRIFEKHGISVKTEIEDRISHYVFIDDGLYTGSRARKDLQAIIASLPQNSTLDVFYIVACSSPFNYTKKIVLDFAQEHSVDVKMHNWKNINNDKDSTWNSDRTVETWTLHHDCLWPLPSLKTNEDVSTYIEGLQGLSDGSKWYLFRKEHWLYDAGIFSSPENRKIVEKEFLLHGISILKNITEHNGMYPLGYSHTPSLGLGSFCAFDMNISNTCPLVLWWGNNETMGNILDSWYPLLPRRINPSGETKKQLDDIEFWGERNLMDRYRVYSWE